MQSSLISTRPMLRTKSGRDKNRRGLLVYVRRMPCARLVNGVLTGIQHHGASRTVCALLMKRDRSRRAKHHFTALRMHFPRVPRLVEGEHADKSAFLPVGGMALCIILVPLHIACELRLRNCRRAQAKMNRMRKDIGAGHHRTLTTLIHSRPPRLEPGFARDAAEDQARRSISPRPWGPSPSARNAFIVVTPSALAAADRT